MFVHKTITLTIQISEYNQIILDSMFSHYLKVKHLRTSTPWALDDELKSVNWDSLVCYKVDMIKKIKETHPDNVDDEGADDVFLNIISDPSSQLYWKSLLQSQ